ncbi:TPA: hypothetical protein ACJ3D1_005671, partial [Klebsiella pneumoniae]
MIIAIFVLIPFFSLADPISVSSGSSSFPPARSGQETQHVPLAQLIFLLYIVFTPCPVTARAPPEKGGVV